jgi:hypothetical protein
MTSTPQSKDTVQDRTPNGKRRIRRGQRNLDVIVDLVAELVVKVEEASRWSKSSTALAPEYLSRACAVLRRQDL